MVRALLVAGMLAGCDDGLGGPCSAIKHCDVGVCDLTDPTGPICISSDGDLDGDGIRNDADFCNHQAGGEFDEDRDGVGDVCDHCPIAPPPATPDRDSDEVDSPCDPDPDVDGDRIVVFDGFNAGLPAGWKASSGFQFVAGEAIATPGDSAVVERLTAPLPLVSQQIAVLVQYRIDRVDPQATQSAVGVIAIDERPAGGATVRCVGTRTGANDLLVLDTDTAAGNRPFANLFDGASLYRVAMKLAGVDAACAMIADSETGVAQAGTGGNVMNEAGLVANGATARFQYLLVVQRGP